MYDMNSLNDKMNKHSNDRLQKNENVVVVLNSSITS